MLSYICNKVLDLEQKIDLLNRSDQKLPRSYTFKVAVLVIFTICAYLYTVNVVLQKFNLLI